MKRGLQNIGNTLQAEEGLNSEGNMPWDEGEIPQGEYLHDTRKIS